MPKKIIILGTGGNCIDILDTIREINKYSYTYECIGFLDDDEKKWGKSFYNIPVLGPLDDACKYVNTSYFVNGIGSQRNFFNKEYILKKTQIPLNSFETIIHPTASISQLSKIGLGTVIFQNVTVASNVAIGNHVMILANSVINHDNHVDDYTIITSGVCISGGVEIGKSCYLGSNSSLIDNIKVGDYSLIGIGSNVLSDVKENSIMIGNPARFLRLTN